MKNLPRTKISPLKRILLRLLSRFVSKKVFEMLREIPQWRISDYVEYVEDIFRKKILRFSWNRPLVRDLNIDLEDIHTSLKKVPITREWPRIYKAIRPKSLL